MGFRNRTRSRQSQNIHLKTKEIKFERNRCSKQVDKHIRRLDADLARFENELKEKLDVSGYESPENRTAKSKTERGLIRPNITYVIVNVMYEENKTELLSFTEPGRGNLKEKRRSKGRGRKSSDDDSPRKKKTKNSPEFSESILPVHPSDVLDMPVDPNEPTYCLCHQVSYGEMIGCDNPDCPIEWFHFACVDLTTKPKGKWFCPRCTQDRKKK
ncbi:hypothetical protein cypCar_00012987 [Cyprinus carpio]|nr:hypothetical protein cypCar_00012987 [Cyprinus carpio]